MFMYILCNYIHQVDDIRVKMMEFVRSSLRIELQPSCRHQLEWIYIYILKTYPLDIHEHLIKLLDPIKVVSVYLLGDVMIPGDVCDIWISYTPKWDASQCLTSTVWLILQISKPLCKAAQAVGLVMCLSCMEILLKYDTLSLLFGETLFIFHRFSIYDLIHNPELDQLIKDLLYAFRWLKIKLLLCAPCSQ